jgi:hypothetical protein
VVTFKQWFSAREIVFAWCCIIAIDAMDVEKHEAGETEAGKGTAEDYP